MTINDGDVALLIQINIMNNSFIGHYSSFKCKKGFPHNNRQDIKLLNQRHRRRCGCCNLHESQIYLDYDHLRALGMAFNNRAAKPIGTSLCLRYICKCVLVRSLHLECKSVSREQN